MEVGCADTGIGIAPEHQTHIFDRFYRADKARSRAEGSSGLGLSIVDWLVKAHNGTAYVESTLGAGSTFVLRLPEYAPTQSVYDETASVAESETYP